MTTHAQLLKRAKKMGYKVTQTLSDELRMLADVTDQDLQTAHYRIAVNQIASDFQVPAAMAMQRLGDSVPKIKIKTTEE